MLVTGEFDILVAGCPVHQVKEISPTHGDHFFCRRIPAVVAEYPADQPGAEKHIGALQEQDIRSGFLRGDRGGAARPTSPNHDNPWHKDLLLKYL